MDTLLGDGDEIGDVPSETLLTSFNSNIATDDNLERVCTDKR